MKIHSIKAALPLVIVTVVLVIGFSTTHFAYSDVPSILVDSFEGDEVTNLLGGKANVYVKAPSRVMITRANGHSGDDSTSLAIKYDKANEGGPYGKGGWCGYYTLLKGDKPETQPSQMVKARRATSTQNQKVVKVEKEAYAGNKGNFAGGRLSGEAARYGISEQDLYRYRHAGDGGPRIRGGWVGHYKHEVGEEERVEVTQKVVEIKESVKETTKPTISEPIYFSDDIALEEGEHHYLDGRGYKAITFWVRGETGDENFVVGLADRHWYRAGGSIKSEHIGYYLPAGRITTEWQQAIIPLDVYFLDYARLYSITISFEEDCFEGGHGSGVVLIDDVSLI